MNFDNIVAVRPTKTVYRDGDKAIKVFNENYSKANVLNEALNQARAEETEIRIPKLHEVTKVDGKWTIVSEFIEGKTLEQLISENPEKLDEYLNLFVDTQIDMHSKRSTLLRKLHDKMVDKIDETELEESIKYDLKTRLAGFEKHNKVLHGDFQLSNVIVDNNGRVFIVDWSHATQGNASADVAMTYLLMKMDKKDELAEKYLDLFCLKTNTDKHYVQTWVPIVAGSHLKKCKPENRAMLEGFINVVQY